MPAKITLAGENTYKIHFGGLLFQRRETYQTDAPRDSSRKRVEDIDSWAQPVCQSLIAFAGFLNFTLKDSDDGNRRLARL